MLIVPALTPPLRGCDELREWLIVQRFGVAHDNLAGIDNGCNWYAWRRSAIPARECECNKRASMQLVVKPHQIDLPGRRIESVTVDVTGEAGGTWFKLAAYSVRLPELRAQLDDIERSLMAAWNALVPAVVPADGEGAQGLRDEIERLRDEMRAAGA